MAAPTFQSLVEIFTRNQSPLVWSLLVSVFGDLAQTEGTRLSSVAIGQITQAIGIKPEATRVALHRLRKEGWLDSERTGRTSNYFLTERGHTETIAASPRIYSAQEPTGTAWLIIAQSENEITNAEVTIATGVAIVAKQPTSEKLFAKALTYDDALPSWMTSRICPPELIRQTIATKLMFQELEQQLQFAAPVNAIEVAVLRVLIVHTWRRIVLRSPKLPDHVFPNAWKGSECRAFTQQLLSKLPVPTADDLVA